MNTPDKAQSDWSEIKGKIKTKWGKFVDTDVDGFKGNMDLISEKLQKTYGYTKDKAEQEYKDFKKTLEPTAAVAAPAAPASTPVPDKSKQN